MVKLGLYIIAEIKIVGMTRESKRYGTLEHVRERKRILEKMIAEMPENQMGATFICRKCLKVVAREDKSSIPLLSKANGICAECYKKEFGWAKQK